MSQLRVVIVEDHALVRAGMRALLQKIDGVEVVSDVGDGWEAVKSVQTDAPDLVLMDIAMPGLNGLDATLRIVKESPTTRVILLSMHANEEYFQQALEVGAFWSAYEAQYAPTRNPATHRRRANDERHRSTPEPERQNGRNSPKSIDGAARHSRCTGTGPLRDAGGTYPALLLTAVRSFL